jgi:hypothetical protein
MILRAQLAPVLQITINNKEDIELFEFASSMSSINNQYYRFISQKERSQRADCRLYVHKISEGSIVIDICEKAPEVLPALVPIIVDYSSFLISTLEYLAGRAPRLPPFYKFMPVDFLNFKKMIEVAANVQGNSIGFLGVNFGKVVVNHTYSHIDANAAQNKCDKEIKRLEQSGDSLVKEKVNLNLYQARDSVLSKTTRGNLGIIEEISEFPKPLSFVGERLQYDITKAEKNPFNFIYSVDVEIKLKEGSMFLESHKDIKEYEILKLHGPIEKKDLFFEDSSSV